MRKIVFAAALVLVAQVASAQSMNAQSFYQRGSALQKNGMLALFSGDLKPLMDEGKAAGAVARQRRLAAIKAGQKPRFCPPDGPISIDNDEFMTRLSAIPLADRSRIDMTEATTRILAAKFPYRA